MTDWVSAWLSSPELSELFRVFGHSLSNGSVRDRLFEAEAISHDIFDFRQGGERWEASRTTFDDDTSRIADEVIALLYREPTATAATELARVDHALVLGARINSCLLRGELMRRLIDEGLDVGHVWGLGSRREVTQVEIDGAAALGARDVRDELDAMVVALQHTLDLPAPPLPHRDSLSEVRPLAVAPLPVTGLAAAPGPGKPRATTSDTYRFFLETAGPVGIDDHLLIVTSAIHAPFQHAQAIGELGLDTGATISTVGAHISASRNPAVRNEWTTAEWLQEIRSTIWSMKQTYLALDAASAS
ncbi:MAG: hypothetical protein EKK51_27985 [Mycolicibacterium sp.]|uniref:hypothetical protein n=1 Tax=Mycolicibacterium sp. TaxID=2320850 RepID=UPI000F9F0862|nr:hypothetical protein [Mycolicibacterium sp.]RUP27152.1 MAG: hypothetical protein EKK51_27985 [Mycolicibacterium sp.]